MPPKAPGRSSHLKKSICCSLLRLSVIAIASTVSFAWAYDIAISERLDQMLALAEEFVKRGDFGNAEKEYNQITRLYPEASEGYNDLGALYMSERRFDSACREFELAAALDPKEAVIQQNLGICLFESNRVSRAIDALEQAESLAPSELRTHYFLGYSLFMTGQLNQAERELEYVRTRKPRDENTLFALVRLYREKREDAKSVAAFDDLVRAHPGSVFVHVLMGESYDAQGKPKDAIAEYKRAIALAPEMPRLHFDLGFLLWGENEMDRAQTEFYEELKIVRNFAPAFYYLGEIDLSRNDLPKAELDFGRALAANSACVDAYVGLGKTLAREHRFHRALTAFRRAEGLDPKSSDAHYWLATVYRHLRRTQESMQEMRAYQVTIKYSQRETGQNRLARRVSRTCVSN